MPIVSGVFAGVVHNNLFDSWSWARDVGLLDQGYDPVQVDLVAKWGRTKISMNGRKFSVVCIDGCAALEINASGEDKTVILRPGVVVTICDRSATAEIPPSKKAVFLWGGEHDPARANTEADQTTTKFRTSGTTLMLLPAEGHAPED